MNSKKQAKNIIFTALYEPGIAHTVAGFIHGLHKHYQPLVTHVRSKITINGDNMHSLEDLNKLPEEAQVCILECMQLLKYNQTGKATYNLLSGKEVSIQAQNEAVGVIKNSSDLNISIEAECFQSDSLPINPTLTVDKDGYFTSSTHKYKLNTQIEKDMQGGEAKEKLTLYYTEGPLSSSQAEKFLEICQQKIHELLEITQ